MISICMPFYDTDGTRSYAFHQAMVKYKELYSTMDIEFVICDDGSPYPCELYDTDFHIVALPLKQSALNPCLAINKAVNASQGDIIVLTNPEVIHTENILNRMLWMLQLTSYENDYIIAACKNHDGRWFAHSTIKGGEDGRGPMPEGSGFHFCTMFTRSMWNKAGGFDEAYRYGQGYEDNDWLYRLERAGANFIMCDDLVVSHAKVSRCLWPRQGLKRNKALFERRWK